MRQMKCREVSIVHTHTHTHRHTHSMYISDYMSMGEEKHISITYFILIPEDEKAINEAIFLKNVLGHLGGSGD